VTRYISTLSRITIIIHSDETDPLAVIPALAHRLAAARASGPITPSFVQRADEFRASIDYGAAADYLRVALMRQPWNATLHVKLADALALQHNETEAQQTLAAAERWGADIAAVEQLRALWAEKAQQYDAAAQHVARH
jgi:hypothetical protein